MINNRKGFTLIEISIVISILAVLTTAGLAAFVNYSRTQTLQVAAYELRTTLNLAKSRAFSQVKPAQCGVQALDGYKVLILEASNGYEMDVICAGNVYRVKSDTFPQNITISTGQTTSTSFFFPVISGGVVGSGVVVLAGYGMTRTITVDSIGTIR